MVTQTPQQYKIKPVGDELSSIEGLLSAIGGSRWRENVVAWNWDRTNSDLDPRILLELEYEKPEDGFNKYSGFFGYLSCNVWEKDSLYAVEIYLEDSSIFITNMHPQGIDVISKSKLPISLGQLLKKEEKPSKEKRV